MLFAQSDDVLLADKRLPAGHQIEVGAEFLALRDDAAHLVIGKVHLVAVLRRPAADAVFVAGGRRVEQERPGNVAVVLGFALSLAFAAEDGRVDDEVLEQLHAHALVDVVVDAQDELRPVAVRILQHGLDRPHVLVQLAGDVETVDPVEQFRDIVRGVLLQVLDRLLDRKGPHAVFEIHFGFLLLFSLPIIYLLHGKLNRSRRGRR